MAALSGLWLAAPFLFGYAARAAAFNEVGVGVAILLLGAAVGVGCVSPRLARMFIPLGLWLLVAPFLFGYAGSAVPLWSELFVGAVTVRKNSGLLILLKGGE